TPACEVALSALKTALLSNVVLAHPDFSRPFILATDASSEGLGAVLSQLRPGECKARPIAFASKSLSRAQARYPAHRLQFLALK
ncbi:interleukin-1 receptor accessory protein-like 1-A isoform X1, partial [Silurus meridionalis]